MRDSYSEFLSKGHLTKEQFFEFGLDSLILSPLDKAEHEWQSLKRRIFSNEEVYVRGFGRHGAGSKLLLSFYENVFDNNNIKVDPTNNSFPTQLISKVTGYSKTGRKGFKPISNYQVSHVFGRTKNIFCFTAPWNIVFIPKIIDPLTGHEAHGGIVEEFTKLFRRRVFDKFERQIAEYNCIISHSGLLEKIEGYFSSSLENSTFSFDEKRRLRKSVKEEFSVIEV